MLRNHSLMRRNGAIRHSSRLLTILAAMVLVFAIGSQIGLQTAIAQDELPVEGDLLFVNTDALNFRDAQGTDSEVIEVLPFGTAVTFVSLPASGSDDEHDWYNVDLEDGTNGWVAGEFLSPTDTSDTFAIGTTVEVATDELNLRAEPGLDAEILDTLATGSLAVIDSEPQSLDDYTWYRINIDEGAAFGWVAGELLNFSASPPEIKVGDLVMVVTDELNIRRDAGVDSEVLDTLENGFTASVIDGPVTADGMTWFEIETDAITGWVAGGYLVVQ